ncbi:Eukaryotic/viral aspartic protease [Phytophthora megakarya]|uniref:Eukaryotic/viral aspartic protease n=1 Tax=Phytophthora megakarya TaxID=4795 RepID=A0A225UJ99_9STRA|nr:Eukaryotic/viral aspartic protease [Phytophthora megakarya]
MERVYDWDLESWMTAIYAILDPITVLVGTVERKPTPIQDRKPKTRPALPPPEYASSEDSDSSIESPKRMSMRRPPRVMQLAATPVDPEAPTTEGPIPKALEDAFVRLMQSTRMQTATGTPPSAPRYASLTPTSRCATTETVPQESTDARWSRRRCRACAPRGVLGIERVQRERRQRGKTRAWFNRLKSASRRDGTTGDEVCALFGDLIAGPARQWYLQLKKSTRTSWTELTNQFRVQYCGKGVFMASRYYHASKHVDETPLEYLYRLNVAGMRETQTCRAVHQYLVRTGARIGITSHADGSAGHGHVGEEATRTTTRSTSTEYNALRHKPIPTEGAGEYDSGREGDSDEDQICDQDRDDEERAKLFVTGHAPQREHAPETSTRGERCMIDPGAGTVDRDVTPKETAGKCAGQHPTDRCLRACKACGVVHEAGKCPLEEVFNQLLQWYDSQKHAGILPPTAEKMLN